MIQLTVADELGVGVSFNGKQFLSKLLSDKFLQLGVLILKLVNFHFQAL